MSFFFLQVTLTTLYAVISAIIKAICLFDESRRGSFFCQPSQATMIVEWEWIKNKKTVEIICFFGIFN